MRVGVVALALVLATTATASALEHRNTASHYSVTLPPGWREIPDDVVRRHTAELVKRSGRSVTFVAGFQRDDKPDFHHPYVLVQHHDARRASLEEVARKIGGADTEAEVAKVSEKLNDIVSGMKLGTPRIDGRLQAVVIGLESQVAGVGPVKCVMAIFPGRDSAVQLNGYALGSEAKDHLAAIEQVLSGFKFTDGRGYSPRPNLAVMGGVIGGLIGAVVFLMRKLARKG